jgi:hypothetical protein
LPYEVWDISTWAVMSHWWLYKPVKSASYRRFDDWSEKMSAELAQLLDLPAARVELALGHSDEGVGNARK